MADTTAPARGPGTPAVPGAAPGRPRCSAPAQPAPRLRGIVPFAVYVMLGLLLPTVAIAVGAFQNSVTGALHAQQHHIASTASTSTGFKTDIQLSDRSPRSSPACSGFLIAYAIHTAHRGALLRRVAITASGVFANFGGVPLAFLFIATLGTTGIVTGWLSDLGFNIYDRGSSPCSRSPACCSPTCTSRSR